jgi:gamma-D-glutamyl-L-lysine dipeptidyl-peptidase
MELRAICKRSVSDLRREPRSLSERVSQVVLGEAVQVLEPGEEWSRVRMERDEYTGWVHTGALHPASPEEIHTYQSGCKWKVMVDILPAWLKEKPAAGQELGRLPFGVRVMVVEQDGNAARVRLPDGRLWWVSNDGLLPETRWPAPGRKGIEFTLGLARKLVGTPYLWGGRTPWGYDCSGFSAAFWEFLGVILPRDADQQFQHGQPVGSSLSLDRPGQPVEPPGDLKPGDLLFFGSLSGESSDERQQGRYASITHVAVSLGKDEIIHANGAAWGVSYNSLNPSSPLYRGWLREHFLGARRYA